MTAAAVNLPRRRSINALDGRDIMVLLALRNGTAPSTTAARRPRMAHGLSRVRRVRRGSQGESDSTRQSGFVYWFRDVRYGWNVVATMPLEQTLVCRRQKRKPVEIRLVVDFDPRGQAGGRVASHDQADQDTVDVHLIAVRLRPTAKAPAVGEARVDGGVERDDVTRKAVGDRDRPAQVDRLDDVDARPLQRGDCGGRDTQGSVDP